MNYSELTFEELVKIVEDLLVIKSDDLDAEALRGQKIFTQLNLIYIQVSRKLALLTKQKDTVEFNRTRHYSGKLTSLHYKNDPLPESILKTDIPNHMNVDPIVVEIRDMVRECERVVKFIEDAKGSLRSRGFDIKNAIDYRKLMMGG